MALVIYTKLKELQIQEKEIYEFGNWLRSFTNETTWEEDDEYMGDYEEDSEAPTNQDGDIMEYPWDDFCYVIIPDNLDELEEAKEVAETLGVYSRFDVYDLNRVFLVVK
jgi:hypothetical protein